MNSKIIRTICFECHSRCGVLLEVKEGKLVGIKGDKEHPISHGYLCPKGRACMEIIYHPERITKPLIRSGTKGKGQFEAVSWDRALDVIAERLLDYREKWGAESVVIGTGTTRGMGPWINRFLTFFGSPNYMAPVNMSGGPLELGNIATCGFTSIPDFASSKCIVLWAHNPPQSWPGLFMQDIKRGLKAGAKLIVVDPRGIPLALKADHWLPIRPGTDTALALGFIHFIIKNELYDKEFVEKWTSGFDRLAEHVASFTPEKCAEITWLSTDAIESAALTYAHTKPACIGGGIGGLCQSVNAFDIWRSLTILTAITGNLEVPGGSLKYTPPTGSRSHYGDDFSAYRNLPEEKAKKTLNLPQYPLLAPIPIFPEAAWKAILEHKPYPVKAIGLFANNPMCSYANSQYVKKALTALDFLFTADYFHTPTTELADVILPPAHWTERDDVEDLVMKGYVFCQPKAVEPVPECRSEKQIFIDLAQKMGLEGYWKTVEESLDYRLEPVGMTFEEFKKVGQIANPVVYKSYEKNNGFETPSGKVELYADYLEDMGIAPLPNFREPPESPVSRPDLWQEYPLVLTTGGRNLVYYHSAHRNIHSLRKRSPDPELEIHPETAAALGIEDGEWVYLATPRGRIEIKARFFEHIHRKVVHAPHGYWYGVENGWERVNINMVTDNQPPTCPVTASVPVRGLLCRVEKQK